MLSTATRDRPMATMEISSSEGGRRRWQPGCVARELQDRHVRELAVVSQDVLRREVLRVPDRAGNPAVDLIDVVARFALDPGMHVVIEGILYADIYGPMLRALAADHRGSTRFCRFDLPFEETLRRHNAKGCNRFGEAELRQWWRDQDPLADCEEHVIGAEWGPRHDRR